MTRNASPCNPNVKIDIRLKVENCRIRSLELESAGSELEKIVAKSLRQMPPAQAPLMAWPVVCGSAVAERTRAISYVDGVLRVAVPDAGWRAELLVLAPRYLTAINKYTVEMVRRIEFVVSQPEKVSQ